MKLGMPMGVLPKTFQEAMTIASQLGYRYIWIDSLCIIQNSTPDWSRESRLMAGVYGNAVLNIAATGDSSDAGCYATRDRPLGRLPCRILSTRNHTLFAQMWQGDLDHYSPQRKQSALLSRAWVVQERLLSKRNVFLRGQELALDCCTTQFSETYPRGKKLDASNLPLKVSLYLMLDLITNTVILDDAKLLFERLWAQLVSEYSAADLKFESDRPVALQGLVEIIQARTHNRWAYVAGLWKEFLPLQLLWSSSSGRSYEYQNLAEPAREPYPSWSWLSFKHQGGVSYAGIGPYEREFFRCRKLLYQACMLEPQLAGGAPTDPPGFLAQSVVKLRGHWTMERVRDSVRPTEREVELDFKLAGSEIVLFLLVCRYELEEIPEPNPPKYMEAGLILRPQGEGFTRVGVWHYMYPRHVRSAFSFNREDEREVLLY
jgi:hypothetical protein